MVESVQNLLEKCEDLNWELWYAPAIQELGRQRQKKVFILQQDSPLCCGIIPLYTVNLYYTHWLIKH